MWTCMWLKRISYSNSNYLVCSFIKTTGTYFCVWSLFKRNSENYTHLPWSQKWGPCIWYYDWKLHLNIEKPRKQKWKDLWMPLIRIHFLDLTHSKTIAKTNKQTKTPKLHDTNDTWLMEKLMRKGLPFSSNLCSTWKFTAL